jgi:hypothetical protein
MRATILNLVQVKMNKAAINFSQKKIIRLQFLLLGSWHNQNPNCRNSASNEE